MVALKGRRTGGVKQGVGNVVVVRQAVRYPCSVPPGGLMMSGTLSAPS